MTDTQIIELYFRRDQRAIAETDAQYGTYCHTIAYNILGNRQDSEECVSDTYLSTWNQLPPKRPNCLSAFLGKITRNLSIDLWRKNHAAKRGGGQIVLAIDEMDRTLAAGQSLEDEFMAGELTKLINAFLRTLPDTERRIFILRYYHLKPVADIAADFGFNKNRVASMLMRTRKKLKDYLTQQGGYEV